METNKCIGMRKIYFRLKKCGVTSTCCQKYYKQRKEEGLRKYDRILARNLSRILQEFV